MLYSRTVTRTRMSDSAPTPEKIAEPLVALPEQFNVATYFVDRNVLEGRGEKTAIECGDERVSYRQLLERTNRVGNVLRQLGVRPEERVVLLLLDTPESVDPFFGTITLGAVAAA